MNLLCFSLRFICIHGFLLPVIDSRYWFFIVIGLFYIIFVPGCILWISGIQKLTRSCVGFTFAAVNMWVFLLPHREVWRSRVFWGSVIISKCEKIISGIATSHNNDVNIFNHWKLRRLLDIVEGHSLIVIMRKLRCLLITLV